MYYFLTKVIMTLPVNITGCMSFKYNVIYLLLPVRWWPLWTPWSGLQWWTLPGTCTWERQSRPQLWPPGHRAQAGWVPRWEARCPLCSCWLFAHICLFGQKHCLYHETQRAGRKRGTRRARSSTGLGRCWVRCAQTQADREAVAGGKRGGGGERDMKRQREAW